MIVRFILLSPSLGAGPSEHEVLTLHPTYYTLHTTHYTLHPTPYTLHRWARYFWVPREYGELREYGQGTPVTQVIVRFILLSPSLGAGPSEHEVNRLHPTPYTPHLTPYTLHPAP